jgi:hypothetical protein
VKKVLDFGVFGASSSRSQGMSPESHLFHMMQFVLLLMLAKYKLHLKIHNDILPFFNKEIEIFCFHFSFFNRMKKRKMLSIQYAKAGAKILLPNSYFCVVGHFPH